MTSPSTSTTGRVTGAALTQVPALEPRSTIKLTSPARYTRACARLTCGSSSTTSQLALRPMTTLSPLSDSTVPRKPPADVTTIRRPRASVLTPTPRPKPRALPDTTTPGKGLAVGASCLDAHLCDG